MTPIVHSHGAGKSPILYVPECDPKHQIKDSVAEVDEVLQEFVEGLTSAFPREIDIQNIRQWMGTVMSRIPIHLQTDAELEDWRKIYGRRSGLAGIPPPPTGTPPGPQSAAKSRTEAEQRAEEDKAEEDKAAWWSQAKAGPPVVSEEAREEHQKAMREKRASRRKEQAHQDRVKKGARSFRTRPNTLLVMKAQPKAGDYPQDSAGFAALTLHIPYAEPTCCRAEDFTPFAFAQTKIPAREWPYHAISQAAHSSIEPLDRPMVPLLCRHLPQALCDDCPGCQLYIMQDLPHWGVYEDDMTVDEIDAHQDWWSQPPHYHTPSILVATIRCGTGVLPTVGHLSAQTPLATAL